MQRIDEKTLLLRNILGNIIKQYRTKTGLSGNKFAAEYDIGNGNLSRIENANVDCKFITLWRIAEALDMKPSELVKLIEDKVGTKFKLIDE